MLCPNCGVNNPDYATHCSNCGTTLAEAPTTAPQQAAPANFKDYMTANIILLVVSLLCAGGCVGMILSIVGIVMGSQAKSAYSIGDYATAESKAKVAKIMMLVTIVMVVISLIATGIILLIYGGSIVALIASEMCLVPVL